MVVMEWIDLLRFVFLTPEGIMAGFTVFAVGAAINSKMSERK